MALSIVTKLFFAEGRVLDIQPAEQLNRYLKTKKKININKLCK